MILLPSSVDVHVALEPIRMHKSFEGLSNAVRAVIGKDPLSGHVFVFLNRPRTSVSIGADELAMLLEGVDARGARRSSRWQRSPEPQG